MKVKKISWFTKHIGINLGIAFAHEQTRLAVKMYLRPGSRTAAGGFDKPGMRHLFRQASEDLHDFGDTRYPIRCLVVLPSAVELSQVSHNKGQLRIPQVLPNVFDQAMKSLFIGIVKEGSKRASKDPVKDKKHKNACEIPNQSVKVNHV